VNLTAGTYVCEWFNPATGIRSAAGSFAAKGGPKSFTAPFAGDAVLYVKSARALSGGENTVIVGLRQGNAGQSHDRLPGDMPTDLQGQVAQIKAGVVHGL
jgi:hypothetical protein